MALNFSALLKPSHMINHADINRLQQGPNPANTLRQQPARPRQAGGGTLMQPGVPVKALTNKTGRAKPPAAECLVASCAPDMNLLPPPLTRPPRDYLN